MGRSLFGARRARAQGRPAQARRARARPAARRPYVHVQRAGPIAHAMRALYCCILVRDL